LADVVERNIAIIELLRHQADAARDRQQRFSDWITTWSGSMAFFYAHVAWFGLWIIFNCGLLPALPPFDPYPFGLLTMIVSLEAIFLSTFVLISQNRQAHLADQRDSLDLQIDLLAEYEVIRMLRLVDGIAKKLGVEDSTDPEIEQLCEAVGPELVLQEIEFRHSHVGQEGDKGI